MKGQVPLPEETFTPWVVKNSVCDYIDVSYVELKSRHRILNASNVLGTIAFLSMIAVPGSGEGEMYIAAIVLLAVFDGCAFLAMIEDGQINYAPPTKEVSLSKKRDDLYKPIVLGRKGNCNGKN